MLEAWSGIEVVPRPELAGRDISTLAVGKDLRLADATCNRAIRFGVTSELFTTTDYPLTRQWARALHDAGFDGIRYWARRDLEHVDACIAVFAPPGTGPAPTTSPAADTGQGATWFTDPGGERVDAGAAADYERSFLAGGVEYLRTRR
ncbi:RES family NAD+ phosphorylase [Rhodococcus rhodochrous]|uniref:RES family NAD+ phosphorylase n=1 Tax=Rhodococcus rhodochrous TaxID=1829 RepID=UPI001EE75ABA|nr:RES family NAD+ phosphorylase [Rhodococcus rhodochrous]